MYRNFMIFLVLAVSLCDYASAETNFICTVDPTGTATCDGYAAPKPGCSCCRWGGDPNSLSYWYCDNELGMQCPAGTFRLYFETCAIPGMTGACWACWRNTHAEEIETLFSVMQ